MRYDGEGVLPNLWPISPGYRSRGRRKREKWKSDEEDLASLTRMRYRDSQVEMKSRYSSRQHEAAFGSSCYIASRAVRRWRWWCESWREYQRYRVDKRVGLSTLPWGTPEKVNHLYAHVFAIKLSVLRSWWDIGSGAYRSVVSEGARGAIPYRRPV